MTTSQGKLKLWTAKNTFVNPSRLRLMMLEKGILDQYEEVYIDMIEKGDQKSWRHTKRNPWGETPSLELPDGSILSETTAIARYMDSMHEGRKFMGESVLEQALDQQWDQRIWHQALGPELELTYNPRWGEHCRKEALATAAMLDRHLSDGRKWVLDGEEPTFCDTTLCVAIYLGKFGPMHTDLALRFEYLDKYWQRWQGRDSFKRNYADGGELEELAYLKNVQ
ncbi:hypothetical protein CI109_106319 [Kwoniella shandongensis]|uniref:GST N-terminal domain-containing protein n=1 Tax=Kwoniella shandongensis TaxID=1734106 RepID=A0A5M6BSI7_9TREE|nr:uncharacterized protein CI109_007073 [Kwoniella shandongensis]KAA5524585.1 hypothetical protein CI109_007073 [Kwoniella shandongensis]